MFRYPMSSLLYLALCYTSYSLSVKFCLYTRWDSNPHALSSTTPSRWRVYQFHHSCILWLSRIVWVLCSLVILIYFILLAVDFPHFHSNKNLQRWAGNQNRTDIFGLGSQHTSRCAIPASLYQNNCKSCQIFTKNLYLYLNINFLCAFSSLGFAIA